MYEFSAHGLDSVMRDLGNPISKEVMKKVFPNVLGAHTMADSTKVDYLIGISRASWHPRRIQKALGGGDFWLWENAFSVFVGGFHPATGRCTSRSGSLYTVLKTVVQDAGIHDSLKIPTCTALAIKDS